MAALVLVLDDDKTFLKTLSILLEDRGHTALLCSNVAEAVAALTQKPTVSIVDLCLAGDGGEELSNEFVRQHLVPAAIPYVRLTSAPGGVPPDLQGNGVFDKRDLWFDDEGVMYQIEEALGL
jgi:DNA-binding NtrC family response regulator